MRNLYLYIIITFLCVSTINAQTTIVNKGPYLILNGYNSEVQVLWQLSSTANCNIEFGSDTLYAIGNSITTEYGDDHQHTYTFKNLSTSTKYFYRMTVNQEIFTGTFFSPPDSSSNKLNFFAYGDSRINTSIHNKLASNMISMYSEDQDFQTIVVSTGDLASNGNLERDWDREFFNTSQPKINELLSTMPFLSCMGNHEKDGILFKKYFPYPYVDRRYWSFDYGPAHFVILDQYSNYQNVGLQPKSDKVF